MINIPKMLKISWIAADINELSLIEQNLFVFLCEPDSIEIDDNFQHYFKSGIIYYTYVTNKYMLILSNEIFNNSLTSNIDADLLIKSLRRVLNVYCDFKKPVDIYYHPNIVRT